MGISFCFKCQNRNICKEVCKPLEKWLNKQQAKEGYSERHRRRKEIVWDAQTIEQLASRRAFKIKYGYDPKRVNGD